MSYRKLEIWQMARKLVIGIHEMMMTKLPRFEMFEEASQIRRSMKSVKSTIDHALFDNLGERLQVLREKLNLFPITR